MTRFLLSIPTVFFGLFLLPHVDLSAATITMRAGTELPINDGDELTVAEYNTAVGSSLLADPSLDINNGFDGFDNDTGGGYAGSWSFSGSAVTDPVASAVLEFGIYDHDSAAPGDQVASFAVDGVDLTSELNAIMNGSGGGVFPTVPAFFSEYNVYSIALPSSAFAAVSDGSVDVSLSLQNGFAFSGSTGNNASVSYSLLTITSVPEPGSLAVLAMGTIPVMIRRRRR